MLCGLYLLSHTTSFSPDKSGTRDTRHETRQTTLPPSQDLTSGWKQPESDNELLSLNACRCIKQLHFQWRERNIQDILDITMESKTFTMQNPHLQIHQRFMLS